MKTPQDVINEWVKRGDITALEATQNADKYTSYIEQAKDTILSFCNIPLKAGMPDGLFFAWVEIARDASSGATLIVGSGAIKSVSEGDTTVTYDVGTTAIKGATSTIDYTALLNRFRRLP